jgi:hypothetical protein
MSNSKNVSLGSVTSRDEFIIGEALATALQVNIAEQLTRSIVGTSGSRAGNFCERTGKLP